MAGGLIALSTFSEETLSSSELFGPVLYFLLRGGLAFAFIAALKGQMNWPFPSDQPLAVGSFRVSAMIVS